MLSSRRRREIGSLALIVCAGLATGGPAMELRRASDLLEARVTLEPRRDGMAVLRVHLRATGHVWVRSLDVDDALGLPQESTPLPLAGARRVAQDVELRAGEEKDVALRLTNAGHTGFVDVVLDGGSWLRERVSGSP